MSNQVLIVAPNGKKVNPAVSALWSQTCKL